MIIWKKKHIVCDQEKSGFLSYRGRYFQVLLCQIIQLPAVAEFSTGETMGHSGDRLCTAFGITRQAQVYAC